MIAAYMDSTNLKPEATANDIKELCIEAVKYNMAAVCIHPGRVELAKEYVRDSKVKICTVIGFPLGADTTAAKVFAAHQALQEGADELDMVINLGAVKDKNFDLVKQEIQGLLGLKKEYPFVLKCIVETAVLNKEELVTLTNLVGAASADYIKTSTGFSTRGVSLEDINIIKSVKTDKLKIKASGGISTLEFARDLIAAGADRLGSSNAAGIVEEYRSK